MLNIEKTEEFLIDESFGQKLKDMAIFFGTIIPVAVTIIQLLLQKNKKNKQQRADISASITYLNLEYIFHRLRCPSFFFCIQIKSPFIIK